MGDEATYDGAVTEPDADDPVDADLGDGARHIDPICPP